MWQANERYPDPAVRVLDKEFLKYRLPLASVERLHTGCRWSEGPVWFGEHRAVIWSDIPNNRMLRWSPRDGMTVWRNGVDFTNGHTRERNGDLLHCSHGRRAILRTRCGPGGVDAAAPDEVVVGHYRGRRLNSPKPDARLTGPAPAR